MALPWEVSAGTLPWQLGEVLWDRTITIKRPGTSAVVGGLPYGGVTEANEVVIITGLICNIALASSGRNTNSAGLPSDSPGPIKWTITLPPSVMATLPVIEEGDIAYDDLVSTDAPLGRRFQIDGFEPSPIGARIDCVRRVT